MSKNLELMELCQNKIKIVNNFKFGIWTTTTMPLRQLSPSSFGWYNKATISVQDGKRPYLTTRDIFSVMSNGSQCFVGYQNLISVRILWHFFSNLQNKPNIEISINYVVPDKRCRLTYPTQQRIFKNLKFLHLRFSNRATDNISVGHG